MFKYLLSSYSMVLCLISSIQAQNVISPDNNASNYVQMALAYLKSEKKLDSTTIYLEQARQFYIRHKDFENYISSFLEANKNFYTAKYYEEGIHLLVEADKDIISNTKAYAKQIDVNYEIARGYQFLNNYDLCIAYVRINLPFLDTTSTTFADHLNLLALSYRRKGLVVDAITAYEKTLAIRKKQLGIKHTQVASVLNNMGVAYEDLRLYNKALSCYVEGLNIRKEILKKDDPSLANILLNIGGLYHNKGEYNNAIQYYDRALAIFQSNPKGFETRIADIFNNLAVTYKNKGAYQESTSYHKQAIQQYEQLSGDQSQNIANVYTNWGNLSKQQKDYSKAIDFQEKAIELYRKTLASNHPRIIAALNNQGVNYYEKGEYNKALTQLQSIVPLIENDAEQRERFANLCNNIADVHFKLKNLSEAKTYNQKALAIQQDIFGKKSYKLAYTYNNLAQIAEAEGNRDEALQYLQNALAANHADFQADEIGAAPSPDGFYKYDYFITSLMHKARLLRRSPLQGAGGRVGDQTALLQAKFLYEVTDSVLTLVRNELLSSDDKIRLSEKFYELSQAAIENCLQLAEATGDQRYLEEAFQFSEKSKNNVLAQSLAANQAKQFAGIPDSLITLENRLQSDINFYKQALAEQPDSLERILYQNELFTAQQAYRILITNLEKDYPFYYQLKYEQTVPRVRAVQFALPENTALVSYFTGDSTLYSFVFTKTAFTVHRSPIGQRFYDQQVGLRKSITGQLNEDYVALANDLYKSLFPFTLNKNINALILIPDGTLNKLPFEALLSKKVNPRAVINFQALPYLINDFEIQYALSASLYHQERTTTTALSNQGEGLLAFAPVFAEPQEIGYFTNGLRNPLAATENTRTMTLDGKFISALPATADEVSAITEVFQQKKQKVASFLFKNANENQLKRSNITKSKYLHIATHGFINEEQPDLSGLLLFPDSTKQEDHILYSGEVYNLKLNADLVVLSACETGLGKVASGEGLLGLSRAFFYAGANNLMVSLWKVQDQATADLMVSFYQEHLNGKSKNFSAPLRQAKLQLIRTEDFSHPYYWSAFVLIE